MQNCGIGPGFSRLVVLATGVLLVGCTSSAGHSAGTSAGAPTQPTSGSSSSSAPALPTFPMADLARKHRIANIHVGGTPDWQVVAAGSLWVADDQSGKVIRVSAATNHVVAAVAVQEPCDGMATQAGAIWVPDCGTGHVLRISPTTNKVVAKVQVPAPEYLADSEGYIAAGAGHVWFVTAQGSLEGIDPAANRVEVKIPVTRGSVAVAFGSGFLWVSNPSDGTVLKVDPARRRVVGHAKAGTSPRFIAAGEDAVWVLDQDSGDVERIDPRSLAVTAIHANSAGGGGCIATGFGAVWVTIPGAPVTRIDSVTGRVTAQFTGAGGDCISTGAGSVWLANNQLSSVWRIKSF